jgi:hypothetical protein
MMATTKNRGENYQKNYRVTGEHRRIVRRGDRSTFPAHLDQIVTAGDISRRAFRNAIGLGQ